MGRYVTPQAAGSVPSSASSFSGIASIGGMKPSIILFDCRPGGPRTFTVPPGVNRIRAFVVGAGESGYEAHAGGSGGGYAEKVFDVLPGDTFDYIVGEGGRLSGYNPSAQEPGGTSSFAATLTATGGGSSEAQSPGAGTGGDINAAGGRPGSGSNDEGGGGAAGCAYGDGGRGSRGGGAFITDARDFGASAPVDGWKLGLLPGPGGNPTAMSLGTADVVDLNANSGGYGSGGGARVDSETINNDGLSGNGGMGGGGAAGGRECRAGHGGLGAGAGGSDHKLNAGNGGHGLVGVEALS